jgi:gliding motility-associated-like protein
VSLVPIGVTDTTPVLLNIGRDTTLCGATSVNMKLTAQDGFNSYLWSTGETTKSITVTKPGTYSCTVDIGCTLYTDDVTITRIDTVPVLNLGRDTSVCNNSTVNIPLHAPSTFNSYLWSTGDTASAVTATAFGTYWVKGYYTCGEVSDTIVIKSIPSNYHLTLGNDTTICNNGAFSLPLTPTSGFSHYTWNTGATTKNITASGAGIYWVKADSTCGSVSDTIQISSQLYKTLNLGKDISRCDNALPVVLAANPGFSNYTWSTGSHNQQISVNTSGIYFVNASYYCGNLSDTIAVTILPSNYHLSLGKDTTICNNGTFSFSLSAMAGFTHYTWNTGATTKNITASAAGTYWVKADSTCGSVSDTIQITSQLYKTLNLGNDISKCDDGQPFILTADAGFSNYTWNTGAHTQQISVASSGIYSVNATYYCGSLSDTVQIDINPIPPPPVVHDTTLCLLSTPASLDVSGQNILWYSSSSFSSGSSIVPTFSATSPGQITFYVTQTINGCTSEKASLSVNIISKPDFELGSDQQICKEETIIIGPSDNNWSYLWNDGLTHSPRVVSESGTLVLSASNQCGSSVDSIKIALDDCECYIFVANAFTPNNDQINDVFQPNVDCILKNYEIKIFDRWGEMVFRTNDPSQSWDGKFKGEPCPQDVYVVQIIYKGKKTTNKTIVKNLTLLR